MAPLYKTKNTHKIKNKNNLKNKNRDSNKKVLPCSVASIVTCTHLACAFTLYSILHHILTSSLTAPCVTPSYSASRHSMSMHRKQILQGRSQPQFLFSTYPSLPLSLL